MSCIAMTKRMYSTQRIDTAFVNGFTQYCLNRSAAVLPTGLPFEKPVLGFIILIIGTKLFQKFGGQGRVAVLFAFTTVNEQLKAVR